VVTVKRILFLRRQLARLLLAIYVIGTFLPSTVASAQTMFFSRPGPGVSRLPLNVMALGAPGFGDVSDAINLATGNFYLEMSGMSRNTNPGTAFTLFGGNWNTTERVRLTGFNAGLRPGGAVPSSFTVAVGDNSNQTFTRLASAPTDAPSWIKRYAAITSNLYYYNNQSQNGTQFSQEWVVLRVREYTDPTTGITTGNTIAHYYLKDGFRYSFSFDGEYADYSQTLYQQYQGANGGDPDGETTTFRTNNSYLANQDGRIRRIMDMYGRATTYVWDYGTAEGGDGNEYTLDQINYLVIDSNANGTIDYGDNGSYAQRINFKYEGGKLTQVTYHTYDGVGSANSGKGTAISRYVKFVYDPTKPVITEVRKNVFDYVDVSKEIVTRYSYDAQNRVIKVSDLTSGGIARTPDTDILYTSDTSYAGGSKVTVRQGAAADEARRETIYIFDSFSRLRKKRMWDFNPDAAKADGWLEWSYGYNRQGSTVRVNNPTYGEYYDYDAKGNLVRSRTYNGTLSPYADEYEGDGTLTLSVTKTTPQGTSAVTFTPDQTYQLYPTDALTVTTTTTGTAALGQVTYACGGTAAGYCTDALDVTVNNNVFTFRVRNSVDISGNLLMTIYIQTQVPGVSTTLKILVKMPQAQITNPIVNLKEGTSYDFDALVQENPYTQNVGWGISSGSTFGQLSSTGVFTANLLPAGVTSQPVTIFARSTSSFYNGKAFLTFTISKNPTANLPAAPEGTSLPQVVQQSPLNQKVLSYSTVLATLLAPRFTPLVEQLQPSFETYLATLQVGRAEALYSSGTPDAGNWERKQVFQYDNDNRLIEETNYGRPGAYNGVTYDYTGKKYTYTSSPVITVGGQTFLVPTVIEEALKVKEFVQYKTRTTLNSDATLVNFGQAQKLERLTRDNVLNRTTTYSYYNKGNQDVATLTSNADPSGIYKVMHYGDQLQSETTEGITTNYLYNIYGGIAQKLEPNAYVSGFAAENVPTTSSRTTYYATDGFGNVRAEVVSGHQGIAYKNVSVYYGTGELDRSWKGSSQNLTDYAYDDSGSANMGRLMQVRKGIDLNNSGDITLNEDAWREYIYFDYSNYGDISSKKVKRGNDIYNYDYSYDNSGRQIAEYRRQDGGITIHHYDATGQLSWEWINSIEGIKRIEHDLLGRTTKVTYPDGNTVTTTYDPFDRPLTVTDSRLSSMTTSDQDRTSYFRYDSLGNLVGEAGPVLRSTSFTGGYTDKGRPVNEYEYDPFNRLTQKRIWTEGILDVNTDTIVSPTWNFNYVYYTAYDAFDRLLTTKQGDYTTTNSYDASGNIYKTDKMVWTGAETDLNTLRAFASNTITSYGAFDAMGRVLSYYDPKGKNKSFNYDLLGNVTRVKDERDVVTHVHNYTTDGLLLCTAEPDMNPATAATTTSMTGCSAPGGYLLTKLYNYSNSPYPKDMYSSTQDTPASTNSPAVTSYTYDYAGRTRTTTLPAANTNAQPSPITQIYDQRGNLTDLTDANGFTTHYDYNFRNQVTHEVKKKRNNNTVDNLAFPTANGVTIDGLHTYYDYDAAGNLVKQTVGTGNDALDTNYIYNTMGKVIGETLPRASWLGTNLKLSVYNLAGQLTAKTTYDYSDNGSLRGATNPTPGPDTNVPIVIAGNATLYRYDSRGLMDMESSVSKTGDDYWSYYWYNGLGQKVKREFNAPHPIALSLSNLPMIYAEMRETDGDWSGSSNYNTYWKYDQNGNLTESWDTLPDGSNKQNAFTYTYSATNKEITHNRNVELPVKGPVSNNASPFDVDQATGVPAKLFAGATNGSASASYNERDLLQSSTVIDYAVEKFYSPWGFKSANTASYSYFYDGNVKSISLDNNGLTSTRTFTYDMRGRELSQRDTSGARLVQDVRGENFSTGNPAYAKITPATTGVTQIPTTITTSYESGGKVTVQLRDDDGKTCTNVTTPTVGGLTQTSTNCGATFTGGQGLANLQGLLLTTKTNTYTYNSRGNIATSVENGAARTYSYGLSGQLSGIMNPSTNQSVYSANFNSNGDITSETNTGSTATYTLDSRGNRTYVTGGQYNNYKKRYNADGKVVEFSNYYETYFLLDGTTRQYSFILFRYDPFGNQVLSSRAKVRERVSNNFYHQLEHRQLTSVSVGGKVMMMRLQDGYYTEGSTKARSDYIRDEAFSVRDGVIDFNWSTVIPFDAVETPTTPLEAPVEALSTTLQIDPMDVVAPSEATPTTPSETVEDITPPADAETTTEPEATNNEPATANTGITTLMTGAAISAVEPSTATPVTEEAVPAGSELADGSTSNPVTTADASLPGQAETLTAPTSDLPESITSVNAQDITTPETTPTTGFSAPSVPTVAETTPDEVVSPDANVAPPQVGATAQDGPLDVVMPEELTASVPSVGGDVPAPIETVTPPMGWSPDDGTVDGFTLEGDLAACDTRWNPKNNSYQYGQCRNNALDDEARRIKNELDKATGGDFDEKEVGEMIDALADVLGQIAQTSDGIPVNNVRILAEMLSSINRESPGEALIYVRALGNIALLEPDMLVGDLRFSNDASLFALDGTIDDARYRLNMLLDRSLEPTLFERWAGFETQYLSFDLSNNIKVENPLLRAVLGISQGERLDGSIGDRMSALTIIDAITIGWGLAKVGGKLAAKAGTTSGRLAASDLVNAAQQALSDAVAPYKGVKGAPAAGIAAYDVRTRRIAVGMSGTPPTVLADEASDLAEMLGGIGIKTACGNVVGRCAEFHAANQLLLQGSKLEDIRFTEAIRPNRPHVIVDRCDNCIEMFGPEQ
jgi:YD repeat-containing protein